MKYNKPIALMLFGIALIVCMGGFATYSVTFAILDAVIDAFGLLISLIGLIMAFREK